MLRRLAGIPGALSLVLLLAACTLPAGQATRYALVYGVSLYVDAYPEGRKPNLAFSDDDAVAMASLLESEGYLVTARVDQAATKANLLADVADLASTVLEGDLVLLYFSGHGGTLQDFGLDPSSTVGIPQEARWILPREAIDPAFEGYFLEPSDVHLEGAIYDGELAEILSSLPCLRRVLIIDACNSGGFIQAGADADALPPDYGAAVPPDPAAVFAAALRAYFQFDPAPDGSGVPPSEALVLAAAGSGEPSYEDSFLGHGVFTYFLLEAATRGDLDGDGYVTALEIYAYARAGVQQIWNADLPEHSAVRFLPRVSGGAVDLALFGPR